MLDELIEYYEERSLKWEAIDRERSGIFSSFADELKGLKKLHEKEQEKVFTTDQEKEIRKYIKEHLEIETTEVTTYDGANISLNIQVRENRRDF